MRIIQISQELNVKATRFIDGEYKRKKGSQVREPIAGISRNRCHINELRLPCSYPSETRKSHAAFTESIEKFV